MSEKLSLRWAIIYDILKNKYKDGRHFADPEHVRNGFIELYDEVAALEARLSKMEGRDEIHWKTRRTLLAKLSKMEELLYEAIEIGGAPESTWVDTDDETKRAWPISDEEALAGEDAGPPPHIGDESLLAGRE